MSKKNMTEEVSITEEVKETPVIAPKEEKKPIVPKKKENLVYIGETIPGLIKTYTTFKDGLLPEKVNDAIRLCPMMNRLFVTTKELPNAVKELSTDSALSTIKKTVADKLKEVN